MVFLQAMPSPRGFKCHLPYKLVLGGEPHTTAAKYITIYRNPKDVAVSSYHHYCNNMVPEKPWDEYLEEFISGKLVPPFGMCFEFFLEWWKHRGKFMQFFC